MPHLTRGGRAQQLAGELVELELAIEKARAEALNAFDVSQ